MKFLFVVNPASGPGQKDWEKIIRDFFSDRSDDFDFYRMEKDSSNKDHLREKIQTYTPSRVIAAGGDGTIKMAAEVLMQSGIPLGIIPAGSANGMAKELNIPLEAEAAILLAVSGLPRPLDLIYINDEYCIHLSDLGLNASLLEHFEQVESRGFFGYAKALTRMLGKHQFIRLTVFVNNRVVNRKVVMAVVANASKYGTGAVINPAGDTSDGEFEVVLVRRLGLPELAKMIITGRPLNKSKVEVIRCKRMRLVASRAYPFQVDGESRDPVKEVNAVIEPGAIQVITP